MISTESVFWILMPLCFSARTSAATMLTNAVSCPQLKTKFSENSKYGQMHLKMLSTKEWPFCFGLSVLTHWGRVTHICVSKLTTIGSDNGLSPGRCQSIIWTNAGILLIQTLGSNFSEILRALHTFSFKKMHMKMSSGKCRPSCLSLNVLNYGLSYYSSTGKTQVTDTQFVV